MEYLQMIFIESKVWNDQKYFFDILTIHMSTWIGVDTFVDM
jgi:hypothetical protein